MFRGRSVRSDMKANNSCRVDPNVNAGRLQAAFALMDPPHTHTHTFLKDEAYQLSANERGLGQYTQYELTMLTNEMLITTDQSP